jgi:hypothetical protein
VGTRDKAVGVYGAVWLSQADWLKVPKTIVGMKNDLRYEMTPEGSLWLGDDNEPVLKADQSGLVSEVDVYVQVGCDGPRPRPLARSPLNVFAVR